MDSNSLARLAFGVPGPVGTWPAPPRAFGPGDYRERVLLP